VIVVDASTLADALLNIRDSDAAAARLVETSAGLHAPHLIDIEVAQVIRRYAARGIITPRRGQAVLEALDEAPLSRFPHALFCRASGSYART